MAHYGLKALLAASSADGTVITLVSLLFNMLISVCFVHPCSFLNVPQIGLDTSYWTAVNLFFVWGSVLMYFAILFAMHSDGLFSIFPSQFPYIGKWPTHSLS